MACTILSYHSTSRKGAILRNTPNDRGQKIPTRTKHMYMYVYICTCTYTRTLLLFFPLSPRTCLYMYILYMYMYTYMHMRYASLQHACVLNRSLHTRVKFDPNPSLRCKKKIRGRARVVWDFFPSTEES